jgi:hypothetical protein
MKIMIRRKIKRRRAFLKEKMSSENHSRLISDNRTTDIKTRDTGYSHNYLIFNLILLLSINIKLN